MAACLAERVLAVVLEIILPLPGREQIIAGKALIDVRTVLADMLAQINVWMVRGAHGDRGAAEIP